MEKIIIDQEEYDTNPADWKQLQHILKLFKINYCIEDFEDE